MACKSMKSLGRNKTTLAFNGSFHVINLKKRWNCRTIEEITKF
jgi:hypothetical protein